MVTTRSSDTNPGNQATTVKQEPSNDASLSNAENQQENKQKETPASGRKRAAASTPESDTPSNRHSKAQKTEAVKTEDVEQEEQELKGPSTPGRVAPILRIPEPPSPDIKPFKGEPGHKVRKTAHEKNEEYKQHIRDNEGHTFHQIYLCYDKGRDGSPTYDTQGFQLDYDKVCDWMRPRPYNKTRIVNASMKYVDNLKKETIEMAKYFFDDGKVPGDSAYGADVDHWKDRVSKDLNVPWHRIEVEHFIEWENKGFQKVNATEFFSSITKAQRERMSDLHGGSALRK